MKVSSAANTQDGHNHQQVSVQLDKLTINDLLLIYILLQFYQHTGSQWQI